MKSVMVPARTLLVAAVALVDRAGRVLVQRRPAGRAMAGLWEFPGGKVEADEAPEDALARELREELGIVVAASALEAVAFASAPLGERHLLLLLYLCRAWDGEPRALEADTLEWHDPAVLPTLAMPPADAPLLEPLSRALGTRGTASGCRGTGPSATESVTQRQR